MSVGKHFQMVMSKRQWVALEVCQSCSLISRYLGWGLGDPLPSSQDCRQDSGPYRGYLSVGLFTPLAAGCPRSEGVNLSQGRSHSPSVTQPSECQAVTSARFPLLAEHHGPTFRQGAHTKPEHQQEGVTGTALKTAYHILDNCYKD